MRLKRLELQGFKSFLDRTILDFDPGITGVVGPNGCGKSNIVDAIQWVMGEQSAKHLRGEAMTDVIFNGSDSRTPSSMAEVSLVLDRQGVPLSPQFAVFDKGEEISITRRVFRDGTGEFLINKVVCRLKDIHELFMDTGVGRRAYSIIEQGQIERMINVKPEERRFLFEEVAGITKYKLKRKEAERKLDATRQNMTRVHDITAELEKQIRSLKVQATRARKYRELKGEMETADLYLLGRSLHAHKRKIEELQARRDELITMRSESDALFGQMDAEVTGLGLLRLEQEKTYQSLGQKERDLSLLIQKLEGQLSLFDERRRHIRQASETGSREEEEIRAGLQRLDDEKAQAERECQDLDQGLCEIEKEVSEGEQRLRTLQDAKRQGGQRKESLSNERSRFAQRTASVQNQRQNAEAREAEILEMLAELEGRLAEVVAALEAHKVTLGEADRKIERCAERSQEIGREATEVSEGVQAISKRLSDLEDELFRTREMFHSRRSRLQSLTELQENLEGYSPTAREILQQLEGTSIAATPLAEVVQPEASLEDHLEMLLGADMNTLLVKTTEDVEGMAGIIQSRGLERVRVLALSEISGAQAIPDSGIPGAVSFLSKVRVKPGYEAAASWWLGNAFLCEEMGAVFQLRARFPDMTLMSRDNRTVSHDDRSVSTGTNPTKIGVFARRREIDELTEECTGLEAKLSSLTQERESALARLKAQEGRHEELKARLSSMHIESVELRKEREKIQLEAQRTERDGGNLQRDLERNRAQLASLGSQQDQWAAELEELTGHEARVVTEIGRAEIEIAESTRGYDELAIRINERKVERSRLTERLRSLEYRTEKIESELVQLGIRRENLQTQRAREEEELRRIDDRAAGVGGECDQRRHEKNETLARISDTKEAFNETCTKLQDLHNRRAELQKRRDGTLSEIQEQEIRVAQEQSSFDHLRGLSIERYLQEPALLDETSPVEMEKLPLFASQLEVDWSGLTGSEQLGLLQEHLKSLRDKVTRYGEVNLTAIQEYDEVQKRYEFLMEQRTDLEKSIQILEEAIQKIDESTKLRFVETFEAVDGKFREIFPILFNGGRAELTLTATDSALDAGVEIMVHPPGKKPASITLLSGGEKALTAVSLILAIFARKPSPFCLLDEVDAPLDEANVSRFNTVVKKMAEKTQFIVITHNKKTMEIAEALYGVTMEKPGVSKMTSVRLN